MRCGRRGLALFHVFHVFLALLVRCAGVRREFFIQENSILVPSSSEYHAYDDSWSVSFKNVDAVDFDLLVFEVCSEEPCPVQLDHMSALVDCAGLIDHFNNSGWHNQYISERVPFSSLCQLIHEKEDELQVLANSVLLDEAGRPWLAVRQPLALEFLNSEHMLGLWTEPWNASDAQTPDRQLVLRVTQVLKLHSAFALHQAVVRVSFAPPRPSSLVLGVQNPCTARGYAAPAFGGVAQHFSGGRERCMWTCRMDLWRQPYNSIPATREQLNASHPDFAALHTKYACAAIPKQWVAVFFGFELDTRMLTTSNAYTQVLYDALDSMAQRIEKTLASQGHAVLVSLAVHDSLYHAVSFREQVREKTETSCMLTQCPSKWFPSALGWNNEHFLYARRSTADAPRVPVFFETVLGFLGVGVDPEQAPPSVRSLADGPFAGPLGDRATTRTRGAGQRRRTMNLHKLQVDGVVLSDDLRALFDNTFRLNMISNLRKVVRAQGDALDSFSATLQISQVEDFDISNVIGFVDPAHARTPPAGDAPAGDAPAGDATAEEYSKSNYVIVVVSIALIITSVVLLVCVLCVREIYGNRRRRHYEAEDDESQ
jgi:hypothetical protein